MNRKKTYLKKSNINNKTQYVVNQLIFFFAFLKEFEKIVYLSFRIKEDWIAHKCFSNDKVKENYNFKAMTDFNYISHIKHIAISVSIKI